MALRAMGPYNGTLPIPTGIVVGFMRDPSKMPYLRYVQLSPADEVVYSWWRLDPDDPVRLPEVNSFAWAYDDYRPSGKGFQTRAEMLTGRIKRWDFPYQIGDQTVQTWKRSGVDPKALLDRERMNHAQLHRASRAVAALQSGLTGNQTSTLAAWTAGLGLTGAGYLNQASGQEFLGGADNPNFQLVQKVFGAVKRRFHLATNGAVTGEELVAVMPPVVALALSHTGEMFEALKQSQFASPQLVNPNALWRLPAEYGGFKIVVEDTPRVFITPSADGTTVASVTTSAEKDYILNSDDIYFVSRPGGLDGGFGYKSFSTLTCFTLNGEARVQAFSEPKHELTEGHVVLEDDFQTTASISGFKLTDVLS